MLITTLKLSSSLPREFFPPVFTYGCPWPCHLPSSMFCVLLDCDILVSICILKLIRKHIMKLIHISSFENITLYIHSYFWAHTTHSHMVIHPLTSGRTHKYTHTYIYIQFPKCAAEKGSPDSSPLFDMSQGFETFPTSFLFRDLDWISGSTSTPNDHE